MGRGGGRGTGQIDEDTGLPWRTEAAVKERWGRGGWSGGGGPSLWTDVEHSTRSIMSTQSEVQSDTFSTPFGVAKFGVKLGV